MNPTDQKKVVTICPKCRKEQTITVIESDYYNWMEGMLIQRAMPYLTADQREALITGYCNSCWEEIFKE